MTGKPDISISNLVAYSMLALPLAFAGMPLYLYAPDFYATEHGLSLGLIGAILLLIRGVDAVQDPVIGWISDRYAAVRSLIMGGGILLLGTSFFMVFHPPETYLTIWFTVSMLLLTTAFSILTINLNTLGGIWTKETHDKTKITACREVFGLLGVILAAGLPAYFLKTQTPAESFHSLSLVFIGLILFSSLIFMSWLFRFEEPKTRPSSRWRISVLWQTKSKALRRFYLIYFVSMLASAVPVVLLIFFVRDRLNAEEYLGLFLTVYFLSGALGMPLWQWVAKRKGKLFSWAMAMVLAITTFIWAYFLQIGDVWQFLAICVGSGLALGAELALPPSILSDLVDQGESRESAAVQFSVQTFLAKSSLALATGIMLPALQYLGYDPANVEDCCITTVHNSLSLSYAIVPCAIKYLSFRMLWRWHKDVQGGTNEKAQPIILTGGITHD